MTEYRQAFPETTFRSWAMEVVRSIYQNPEAQLALNDLIDQMAAEQATPSTTIHLLASFCQRTYFSTDLESPYGEEPATLSKGQMARLNEGFDLLMAFVKRAHDRSVSLRLGTDSR